MTAEWLAKSVVFRGNGGRLPDREAGARWQDSGRPFLRDCLQRGACPRRTHAEASEQTNDFGDFQTMPIRSPSRLPALLLLGATAAFADPVVPPPAWPALKDSPVTLAADPVRPLLMGTLRISLDGSTLVDTRQAIGAGILQHQGKGTDALDWLCYTLSGAGAAERLWLTSSELSRGRIDAVVAAELPTGTAPAAQCPELPARFKPVRFDDGLWLGTPGTELRKALGIPAKAGAHFSSLFQGQTGNLQLVSSTVIEFRGSRAVSLYVAHSTQN
jgi:hypothetical protein